MINRLGELCSTKCFLITSIYIYIFPSDTSADTESDKDPANVIEEIQGDPVDLDDAALDIQLHG